VSGLTGGIIGTVIGLAGGALGTYFSIHNTKTPAERAFVVKGAVAMWMVMALLFLEASLAVLGLVPRWAFWTSVGAFWLLTIPAIIWANRRQRELRGD
jgi:hypothetical protein